VTNLHTEVSVTFRVLFTPEEVAALKFASETHYDAVCRTFQPLMILTQYVIHELEPSIVLSWRDLDTLSKICESPHVPHAISEAVWTMFKELRQTAEKLQKELDRS
jgi:hypothetical protein